DVTRNSLRHQIPHFASLSAELADLRGRNILVHEIGEKDVRRFECRLSGLRSSPKVHNTRSQATIQLSCLVNYIGPARSGRHNDEMIGEQSFILVPGRYIGE